MPINSTDKTKPPRVLAVIPARGGSKRFPHKNITSLGGKPMIAWSIAAANAAESVTEAIVSTDDGEIASIAKAYGGNVPFHRPSRLAGDNVRNSETLVHAVEWFRDEREQTFDIVLLLQPTSPLRQAFHIDVAVKSLWASDALTIASVTGPHKKRDVVIKKITPDGALVNYYADDPNEGFYRYNASIYGMRTEYLMEHRRFTSENEIPLVMDAVYSIDVDEILDGYLVEAAIKYLEEKKA
jgi:CMP-N-acetylneuraminic acid synthetase